MNHSNKLILIITLLVVGCSGSDQSQTTGLISFSNAVDAYFEALEFENSLKSENSASVEMTPEQHAQWVALYKDASEKADLIVPDSYFQEVMGEEIFDNLDKFVDGLKYKYEGIRDFDNEAQARGIIFLSEFSGIMNRNNIDIQKATEDSGKILWEWGPIKWEPSDSLLPTIGCNTDSALLSWVFGCP